MNVLDFTDDILRHIFHNQSTDVLCVSKVFQARAFASGCNFTSHRVARICEEYNWVYGVDIDDSVSIHGSLPAHVTIMSNIRTDVRIATFQYVSIDDEYACEITTDYHAVITATLWNDTLIAHACQTLRIAYSWDDYTCSRKFEVITDDLHFLAFTESSKVIISFRSPDDTEDSAYLRGKYLPMFDIACVEIYDNIWSINALIAELSKEGSVIGWRSE